MNNILIKVGIGVLSAGVGALVSHLLTKRYYEKEIKSICDECTKDVHEARMETKKYKDYIKATQPNGIDADIWANLDNVLNLQKPVKPAEDPATDEVLSRARKQEDYTDYTAYFPNPQKPEAEKTDIPEDIPIHTHQSDIRYITDFEYDENEWGYEKEYLNFYTDSELLFNDITDELIEDYEVGNYIGEDLEGLRARFRDHRNRYPNDVHEFYVYNHQHEKLYNIVECMGDGPR